MKNFGSDGDSVQVTAPYAVTPGDGMLIGSLFCVSTKTAAQGALTDAVTIGQFDLPALSTDVFAEGAVAYWDGALRRVSTSSGTPIGVVPSGKLAGVATVRVRLTAGAVAQGAAAPPGIDGYNSFTVYEEFDRALADLFVGSMTGVTTGSTASSGMTATFTTTAIQSDIAGINGAMYYNSGANQAAGTSLRYNLHGNSPGRMVSMFRQGFRAEMRFALEVAEPNRVVQFGWFSRTGTLSTDGMPGCAGTLIVGQTVYLIRRDPDAGVQRKDEIATLQVGKVYTISADTTSGQLVHTITNNTDGGAVDTRTVPKWTGFVNMANDMDLFGSAPSNAKFPVFFGVCGGVHALTAAAVNRLLTMDAFYVHCPKMR